MKGLFLGAHSILAQTILEQHSWSHLFLHSQHLNQLIQLVEKIPEKTPVELFACDFAAVHEDAFLEFTQRSARLQEIDMIVVTVGSWLSHTEFKHLSLEEIYTAWQVNYFYPLSLLKAALPLAKKGTVFVTWTLDPILIERPLWSSISPLLSAWKTFVTQLAVEEEWTLKLYETSFVKTPQSLKIFPDAQGFPLKIPDIIF
jgi:NAD(P)-dependent dehydrogenase (short-subunit alcohol dehydrogenase family)